MSSSGGGGAPSFCTRLLMFADFILFCLAVALVVAAFSTQFWFEAWPVQKDIGATATSYVHSGYFAGVRSLDYGLGVRHMHFNVYDEITSGVSSIGRPAWLGSLAAASVGCLFGGVGVLMALLNAVGSGRARSPVAGPMGLVVWSAMGGAFTSVAAACYAAQYHMTTRANCLLPKQIEHGFTSDGRSRLSYSFYLLLGSVGVYALVIVGLVLANVNYARLWARLRPKKEKPVRVDGSIMMY